MSLEFELGRLDVNVDRVLVALNDWQGRALAAEAAADGYRQRAERAEAEMRITEQAAHDLATALREEKVKVSRAKALADRWLYEEIPDPTTADVDLRAALSAPEPVDGSAHHPDTDNAADGHTGATAGVCDPYSGDACGNCRRCRWGQP